MNVQIVGYEDGIPVDATGNYVFPNAKDLPKTHFPVPDRSIQQGWILVRIGEELPQVGQEILFIKDIRGTQDEFLNTVMNMGAKLAKKSDQEVMTGIVTEVGYSEELGDHWIKTCKFHSPNGSPIGVTQADHITYWKPLGEPPEDTYKRSPYSYHQIFKIVQAASTELSQV